MADTIRVHPYHKVDVNALKIGGVEITATPAEINAGVLGGVASMTTATTPASGSCAVQLVFKDADGVTMAVPTSGLIYVSEVATGLSDDPVDGLAVLTNGSLSNLVAHGTSHFITTAAGLLGVTITHSGADSFWLIVVLPSGKLLISDECEVQT